MKTVYIVFKISKTARGGYDFVGVFWDRKRAEDWIQSQPIERQKSHGYMIEWYDEPKAGETEEVYDVWLTCPKQTPKILNMTNEQYEKYIRINTYEAFEKVKSGEWTKYQFEDWYIANVMEAESKAVAGYKWVELSKTNH